MEHRVSLSPRKVTTTLILIALCLTLASVAGNVITYSPGNAATYPYGPEFPVRNRFVLLFELDGEHNFPAWYEASLFLGCAFLLATIAWTARRERVRSLVHWAAWSIVFLGVSLDKVIHMHAIMSDLLRLSRLGLLLVGFLIVIVVWLFLRSLAALPATVRRLMLLAGLLVAGSLGMDRAGEVYAATYSERHLAAALIGDGEGLLELLGTIVFMHGLLVYRRVNNG